METQSQRQQDYFKVQEIHTSHDIKHSTTELPISGDLKYHQDFRFVASSLQEHSWNG